MRWLPRLACCALLAWHGAASAQVWRCPGPEGPIFTDKPCVYDGAVLRKNSAWEERVRPTQPQPPRRVAPASRAVPAQASPTQPSDGNDLLASEGHPAEPPAEVRPRTPPLESAVAPPSTPPPATAQLEEDRPMPPMPSMISICAGGFCLGH